MRELGHLAPVAVTLLAMIACTDPAAVVRPADRASSRAFSAHIDSATVTAARYSPMLLARARRASHASALGINDQRVIVGQMSYTYAGRSAFAPGIVECETSGAAMWRNGKVVMLHEIVVRVLGLDPCTAYTTAVDINNAGVIVGNIDNAMNEGVGHYAFIWSETLGVVRIRELGETYLSAINDRGLAVGYNYSEGAPSGARSFGWTAIQGTFEIPGPPQPNYGWETVWDVNDAGTLIGCSDGTVARWSVAGISTLTGLSCFAVPVFGDHYLGGGISNRGDAAFSVSGPLPFRWKHDDALPVDIGWGAGGATDISDAGRMVGWREMLGTPATVAYTRRAGEGVSALPAMRAGDASVAMAVNRCGDVVGWTQGLGGALESVIWRIATCDAMPR